MAWRYWRQPTLGESVAVVVLVLLFVVAAFNQGWITAPQWYTSRFASPSAKALERATPAEAAQAAASAVRAQQAAKTSEDSAKFAAEGSARNASSAASSARSSATSAAAAKVSEGKSEAAAVRAEKAANRAEAAKATPKAAAAPKAVPSPTPPPEKRAERKPDTRVNGAGPESFSSLQPFQRFARGAGEGMAYEYKPRSKAEFVALLRDKDLAKREMRVPCEVIVRQMAEGHKALPLEGCEGTAALIERDSRFVVVACNDEMFLRSNFLTVTNESGSGFGVWHRKCLPNEQVLAYDGQPLISLLCLNVAVPVASEPVRPAPAAAAPPPPAAAPPKLSTYALQINCMSDRIDGYWRSTYESAKARREQNLVRTDINKKGMVPYWEVFTSAPFGNMLAERKSRPQDCAFIVRILKKEPVLDIRPEDSSPVRIAKYNEYLKQFQNPPETNVLSGQQRVSTGNRGWVIVPITVPLEQFEAVLVQPETLGEVLEPVIAVHRPEFATQSNPIHIWEVKQ